MSRDMRVCAVPCGSCRDLSALESEDPGRRKSVQIMPVDSSPSVAPSHSASAERLQESEELRSSGMRITFKVLHGPAMCTVHAHASLHLSQVL